MYLRPRQMLPSTYTSILAHWIRFVKSFHEGSVPKMVKR